MKHESRNRIILSSILALSVFALDATQVLAANPGGFVEKSNAGAMRPLLTKQQIQNFLPEARGGFLFPAPYGTQAARITVPSDCEGADCVRYVGYSYWKQMNYHVGKSHMQIFITLKDRGGPTLFSYDKSTHQVFKVGPIFPASNPLSNSTAELWYWSAVHSDKLYINDGPKLLRHNVATNTTETVFDAARLGSNRIIWQMHSSNDDKTHSATIKDSGSFADLGCAAYREALDQIFFFPAKVGFDECQIDRSGRWLLIKENEDDRIIDLLYPGGPKETTLLDKAGAGGHSDTGFGYMVAADNWNNLPNAIRLWKFDNLAGSGNVVYHTSSWAIPGISHISHINSVLFKSPEQQYACGSNAVKTNQPQSNEIVCFKLDGSLDTLVVAPVMTDMDASGGGDSYAKLPKGSLDVTGEYFLWTSNMGGDRLDAFLVKVPFEKLSGTNLPPDGKLLIDRGVIYIMEGGLKRPFCCWSAFTGLGFKLSNVISADTSSIQEGIGIFSAGLRHTDGVLILHQGTVYIIEKNLRRPFPSEQVFYSWSHNFKDVVPANSHDLMLPKGAIMQAKP